MIKHIVMWKFAEQAEGKSKAENMQIFKTSLEALVGVVPEIISLEVGIDELQADGSYDIILLSTFASMEDLQKYNAHPQHQEAAAFCAKVRESRVAVDYTF